MAMISDGVIFRFALIRAKPAGQSRLASSAARSGARVSQKRATT
jgi:hypothetical protein